MHFDTQSSTILQEIISGSLRTGSRNLSQNNGYICMIITSLQFEILIPDLKQCEAQAFLIKLVKATLSLPRLIGTELISVV